MRLLVTAGFGAPCGRAQRRGHADELILCAYPAKGNYFSCSARAVLADICAGARRLGVHLTPDMADRRGSVPMSNGRPCRLRRRSGAGGTVLSGDLEIRLTLPDGALMPSYSGIRLKIKAAGGCDAGFPDPGPRDHGLRGLINLFGIESPD
jgi:hypothetical protein